MFPSINISKIYNYMPGYAEFLEILIYIKDTIYVRIKSFFMYSKLTKSNVLCICI